MPQPYAGKPASAPGKVAGRGRQSCRQWLPVLRELEAIFKTKFAWHLHCITGRDVRVCERWKTGKHAPDFAALHALLNDPVVGERVFRALTRDNPPAWARELHRSSEIAQLRNLQEETQRRLEALEKGLDNA